MTTHKEGGEVHVVPEDLTEEQRAQRVADARAAAAGDKGAKRRLRGVIWGHCQAQGLWCRRETGDRCGYCDRWLCERHQESHMRSKHADEPEVAGTPE
jgi:hypothetical protein